MGAVSDTYTFDVVGTELRDYLCIGGRDEDPALRLWLAAATDAADRFLNNPFDGTTSLAVTPIPETIKLGVFEYVRLARVSLGANGRPLGLVAKRTGDLAETYSQGGGGVGAPSSSAALADALFDAVKGFWRSWRCSILH